MTIPIAGTIDKGPGSAERRLSPPAVGLWSRDGVIMRTAMVFLPLALATIVVFYLLYSTHLAGTQSVIAAGQRQLVEVGLTTLSTTLDTIGNDAQFVSAEPMLARWLTTGDEEDKAILLEQFRAFVAHRGLYDQLRFIAPDGKETLRINWNGGDAQVVPDAQLQDKSGEYYVQRSLELPPGGSYVSPLDLNVENGTIQDPPKPVIAVSRQVTNAAGELRGIVVLSYLGTRAIDRVQRLATEGLGQAWLINAQGYWLLGPGRDQEWGFRYPDRAERSFSTAFPAAWAQMEGASDNGQFAAEGDLFSFAPVFLPEGAMTGTGALVEATAAPSFYLVTRAPAERYSQVSAELARTYLVPLVGVLLVLGVISWVIANHGVKRRAAELLAADLNARLARDNSTLEIVNRELESFSYSVSHDLRAPLRSIDGFSQALLEDYSDALDATGRDYLARVRNAAQRMGDLIDDLLKLARVTRSELSEDTVDLSLLARRTIADLRQREPDRQVEITIEPDLKARGDYRLLQIMLENLLGNAWKFTSKKPDATIAFGAARQKGQTVYFVRDNGAGFDMAHATKLFGVFQRLHAVTEFEGTGIGLATVQRIVYKHGGRVWADAERDRGATFSFTLEAGAHDNEADFAGRG